MAEKPKGYIIFRGSVGQERRSGVFVDGVFGFSPKYPAYNQLEASNRLSQLRARAKREHQEFEFWMTRFDAHFVRPLGEKHYKR